MISPFELKIINQNFTVSEKKFFTSTTFNGLEEVATLMIVSLLFQGRWSMCQFFESRGLCRLQSCLQTKPTCQSPCLRNVKINVLFIDTRKMTWALVLLSPAYPITSTWWKMQFKVCRAMPCSRCSNNQIMQEYSVQISSADLLDDLVFRATYFATTFSWFFKVAPLTA